jgi:uncharacterized protein YndB with AHSA1/START domain
MKDKIKVEAHVKAPIELVWNIWNDPKHITQWCSGHPDWHTTKSTNDLRVGGKIHTRMEAKDGSMGFDWTNTYDEVIEHQLIKYHMEDGRECETTFEVSEDLVKLTQIFDPESENTKEQQKEGWQNIVNNFKAHVESL